MMKRIQMNYSDLIVDIELNNNIVLLRDYSGTGKTFLYTILISYFQENNIPFSFFDYKNSEISFDVMRSQLSNKEYVLMDCADLYMTEKLWNWLKKIDAYCIISMKGLGDYNLNGVDICTVKFTNDNLRLERLV